MLLNVLEQTAVLTAGQRAKLANVKRAQYLGLVLGQAAEVSVPMPATAVAHQMYTAAMAKGMDEDFSIVIKFMQELSGLTLRE
jgi:3-hydroxyisobutyrate dehydrogenase-like beta-hydroxyacid dehydrogenase